MRYVFTICLILALAAPAAAQPDPACEYLLAGDDPDGTVLEVLPGAAGIKFCTPVYSRADNLLPDDYAMDRCELTIGTETLTAAGPLFPGRETTVPIDTLPLLEFDHASAIQCFRAEATPPGGEVLAFVGRFHFSGLGKPGAPF